MTSGYTLSVGGTFVHDRFSSLPSKVTELLRFTVQISAFYINENYILVKQRKIRNLLLLRLTNIA